MGHTGDLRDASVSSMLGNMCFPWGTETGIEIFSSAAARHPPVLGFAYFRASSYTKLRT